jgi:cell surface protein SprA
VAVLKPNSPKNADFQGETTTYLDDFEGAQALIDIRSSLGWTLASPPLEFFPGNQLPGSSPEDPNNLLSGYGRAKMAWYTIDPIFYTNQRPAGITDADISLNATRRVFIDEVFPQVDIAQGQTTVQGTLDLAYYPNLKGPYNANPNFVAESPEDKWAGIMRSLSSTNFEQSNVEFVQFWVLDPYVDGEATSPGELVINLGNISEDVLKDGKKQYENGLPGVAMIWLPKPPGARCRPPSRWCTPLMQMRPTERCKISVSTVWMIAKRRPSIMGRPMTLPLITINTI